MTNENKQPDTEQDTNSVMNDDAYFAALNKAVSDGNDQEIDRLMKLSDDVVEHSQAEEPPQDNNTTAAQQEDKTSQEDATIQGNKQESVTDQETDNDNPLLKEIEALKRQMHALSSNSGRVNHLQSEVSRLKKEVDKHKKLAAETAASKPSKVEEKISEVRAADEDLAEALAAMREEYAAFKAAPPVEEVNDDVDLEAELERVKSIHPDVDRILPGGDMRYYWDKWKDMLHPEHRALAESSYAHEYAQAVSAFKTDFPEVLKRLQPQQQNETTQVTTSTAEPNPVQQARERKLASDTSTRSTANKQDNKAIDEDALYSQIYQDIVKKDNIR